jgi:hypothetical protein
MTMTLPASTPAPANSASLDQVLRVVIALIGTIEGINGLTDLSILFGDISKIPGYTPGGLTILASIVLHPILGFAALAFALTRRLRYGIIALAVFALTEGASDMPSVIRDGLEWSGSAFVNATAIFKFILQPVIALGAIAAAWFNRYLTLATIGVMLPTLVDIAGVVAFAIAVSIHGF